MAERGFRLVAAAVAGVVVARHLGPSGLGLLTYAQSVYGVLAPIATLGLPSVLVREFSIRGEWRTIFASAVSRQLPVVCVVSAIGFGVLVLTRSEEPEMLLVALALTPLPLLAINETVLSYLEATGGTRVIVRAGVASATIGAAVKVGAVVAGAPLWAIAVGVTVEGLLALLLLVGGLPSRNLRALVSHSQAAVARSLVREAWPLLLAAIAVTLYMRIDMVMLGLLSGDDETGVYAAAVRLSEMWYFVPMAALAAVRPKLARLHANDQHDDYMRLLQAFAGVACLMSYAAIGGALIFGPFIVELLYGSDFSRTADVLRVHVLAAPFVFVSVAVSPWFIDQRMSQAVLRRTAAGAFVNLLLNLALIPSFGAMGAAVATLVSYSIAGVALNGLSRHTRPLFRLQRRALLLRQVDLRALLS